MRIPLPKHFAALVSLALVCVGGAARAQSTQGEREDRCTHVDRAIEVAVREREARRTLGALEVLEDLARRCPQPRVIAQLALAEMDALRWGDAWTHLEAALANEADSWILSRRAALLVARAEIRPHLCQLALRANVPGAELRVGGRSLGRFPLAEPVLVGPGAVTAEVFAEGYAPFRRSWTLNDGQRLEEELLLTPLVSAPSAPPRAPPPPPPVVTSPLRYAGFAAVGAGAVALTVGVIFLTQSALQSSRLESADATSAGSYGAFVRYVTAPDYTATDRSVDTACGMAEGDFRSTDARLVADLCASNSSARTLAWVFALGGLAIGAAGVALIVTHPSATSLRVAPSLAPGFAGLTAQGTF